jgi:amino acid adenylation domain-containing protein
MMVNDSYSERQRLAANQNIKERDYWLEQLKGEWVRSSFPHDIEAVSSDEDRAVETVAFEVEEALCERLMKVSGGSDHTLHLILLAGLADLVSRYTDADDIVVATPIFRQETGSRLINTLLTVRSALAPGITFKDLLLQVRETVRQAVDHQNYPVEILAKQLDRDGSETDFPLFDMVLWLENIHEEEYLRPVHMNMIFSFLRHENRARGISGKVTYNPRRYRRETVETVAVHLALLLEKALSDVNEPLSAVDILTPEEKRRLLVEFNDTAGDYPETKTLHRLFEEQVERTPEAVALVSSEAGEDRPRRSTGYDELNRKANRIAHMLIQKGVGPGHIVGIMMDNSIDMVAGILGILKAGGAYLPISPELPLKRVTDMLNDSGATVFLSKDCVMKNFKYAPFKNFEWERLPKILTPKRPQEMELDKLQFPDRSLVDYEKYHPYIGQSMVKNSVTVQFSRGCVFKCLYCFKIWPDKYSMRTGENLFEEVNMYYKLGIRRFGFTDDLPNFNKKEISKFYRLVIKNKLKIHMHFPNGIRGDVLTPDFIDLLMEAGAVTMDLALETASPRLQKLIKKNVNIERLRENVQYILDNYPQAILGVQIMHGFPTETEEEARTSLRFIKSFRWLPFGYMHILKIYPNTAMARFAMENGISEEAIIKSVDMGYHELPLTLPFDENFTRQCQSEYLGDFFLNKERLISVLPNQMSMLTEDELVQKYNSYLPEDIHTFDQLLTYVGISRDQVKGEFLPDDYGKVENFQRNVRRYFPIHGAEPDATRILLLDLSQHFTDEGNEMYHVVDPPLGLMYLLTHLNKTFGSRVEGKIAKSQVDFDSYEGMKQLLEDFKPDIIGVRTLTYFKDFFHKSLSLMRQWGFDGPIISGGPYATSSYETMLQDKNVDLVVLEEGEITMAEVMTAIMENGGKMPGQEVLKTIKGLAFVSDEHKIRRQKMNREIILIDRLKRELDRLPDADPVTAVKPGDPAYVIYTSGSTGMPKGVLVQHGNAVNQVAGLKQRFHLDESYRYLLLAAFTFDVSVMHMFSSLTTGARLFVIPEEFKKDPLVLWRFIHENKIDILNIVPAFMKAILGGIEKNKIAFKYLFVGGDVFDAELYEKLRETFKADAIMNIYGPTETTINAALYPCEDLNSMDSIPIGKPLMNYRAYILDSRLRMAPVGAVGELYIGGAGVTRGYLNRPELTAEKFIFYSPDRGGAPERLYRTGDRVCWLPDGNIRFLGRGDQQVKVRGFRIQLEEIEKRLLAMEEVKETVITIKEDEAGDKYLCAYVTTHRPVTINQLKECLAEDLPRYMIPSYIYCIETIPLSSSGKVDMRRLKEAELKVQGEYVPPSTAVERKLVDIWSEILGMEPGGISVDVDFFQVGGHSLKATILISKIHKEFDVKMELIKLFRKPTIRGLAAHVEKEAGKNVFTSIEPAPKQDYYPLSSAQKRLFFICRFDNVGTGYNMPVILKFSGEPDVERYKSAFRLMAARHETLRTSFMMVDDQPVQVVKDFLEPELPVVEIDVRGFSRGDIDRVTEEFVRPFDFSRAPLFRVQIVKALQGEHLLLFDIHHIICDGVSMKNLTREFIRLYSGENPAPLKLQYKDFTVWQNRLYETGEIKKQEEFWLSTFKDARDMAPLNVPTDFPRPDIYSVAGDSYHFGLESEDTQVFKELCRKNGATLFMNLLGALYILLHKYSGQDDIVVGSGVMGRPHDDLMDLIGLFVNMLALRNFPVRDKSCETFLDEVKENAIKAFQNQDVQFEVLTEKLNLERDPSRNPLFDVSFGVLNFNDPGPMEPPAGKKEAGQSGLMAQYDYQYKINYYDLSFFAQEVGGEIRFKLVYSTALFKPETITAISRHYLEIIRQMSAQPGVKIEDITLTHDVAVLTSAIEDDEESRFEF